VVKNRHNGVHNPDALFRSAVSAHDVLASRIVCEPLRLWMLCSPDEGAAAVVLRRASSRPGVTVEAAALRSHLPGSVLGEATPLSGIDDTDITPPSTLAAHDAYEEAGVAPDEVDVVECQDTDAARELLAYQELGLCEAGDQAKLLAVDHPDSVDVYVDEGFVPPGPGPAALRLYAVAHPRPSPLLAPHTSAVLPRIPRSIDAAPECQRLTVTSTTPASTSAAPANCTGVMISSNPSQPKKMVVTGPRAPKSAT